MRLRPPKSAAQRARVDDGAREQVRARPACPSRARRTARRRAARRAPGAASSSWPSRIAHARPAGPAPTIRTPTSIRSSGGSLGSAIDLAPGRTAADSRRARRHELRGSDELGQLRDDLVQVADDAEVANSKIGAFGVLVDGDDRRRSSACRPCAGSRPRCRRRRRASARRVFPVWPTCVGYGYQPASTTARVAATAPPSAFASSSTSAKLSGPPRPRPPATITSASSIDGPLRSSCACSTIVRRRREVLELDRRRPRPRAAPPVSAGSNAPERKSAMRGSRLPADVDEDGVRRARAACRRGCRPRARGRRDPS